jgi:hypothetical protein
MDRRQRGSVSIVTTPVPDLNETRILVPAGALGSGVSAQEVKAGLALAPHGIALDAGSTDSGPARVRVKRVSSFSPSPQRMARDSACRSSMKRPIRNDGGTLLDNKMAALSLGEAFGVEPLLSSGRCSRRIGA